MPQTSLNPVRLSLQSENLDPAYHLFEVALAEAHRVDEVNEFNEAADE